MDIDEAVSRTQDGDIAAFEEVVRQTATGLRCFLAMYVRDLATVEDLAQETYLRAFKILHRYVPGTSFMAYLRTVARNTILAHGRARQRSRDAHRKYVRHVQERVADRAADLGEPQGGGPLARLQHCVERLSDHARQMVMLRYADGLSVQEVGERTGRSANTVGVALLRIRRQLADCVEADAAPG